MPQPLRGGRGSLFVKLAGGAEALEWKLYSPANVVLAQLRLPGYSGRSPGRRSFFCMRSRTQRDVLTARASSD